MVVTREQMRKIILAEEELYARTIARGMEKLYEVIAEIKGVSVETIKAISQEGRV